MHDEVSIPAGRLNRHATNAGERAIGGVDRRAQSADPRRSGADRLARRRRVLLVQRPDPRRRRGLSAIYKAFRPSSLVELDIADDEGLQTARRLIRQGFPVGPSSGLNYRAALMAAEQALDAIS